jgi:hypothetical protein
LVVLRFSLYFTKHSTEPDLDDEEADATYDGQLIAYLVGEE